MESIHDGERRNGAYLDCKGSSMKAADICKERSTYNGYDCLARGQCVVCQEWLDAWRENLQDTSAEQLREPFIQAMRAEIDGRDFTLPKHSIPEPVGDTHYPDRYLAPIMRRLRIGARLLGRHLLRWARDDAEGNGQVAARRND
jgi:GNAT superfamily N-acetyltransferase